jgi:hypothetical protein
MPIKKAERFWALDWTTKCPYCEWDNDIPGVSDTDISEGARIKCDHCKKIFISSGWVC